MTFSHGQPIAELDIPEDAKRVDFRFHRRKAYAYGWWRKYINIVCCYSCGERKNLVDFDIVPPGGSFPRN